MWPAARDLIKWKDLYVSSRHYLYSIVPMSQNEVHTNEINELKSYRNLILYDACSLIFLHIRFNLGTFVIHILRYPGDRTV